MAIVYLCLGSNIGDRVGYVQQATSLIGAIKDTKIVRTSSLYETQPWLEKETAWFVNAVIEIKTNLSPQDLLNECLRIEKQLGRIRNEEEHFGDRTIDIDILFYGKDIIEEEDLRIPHKYLDKRAFVLVPFLEINPDFIHPELDKSITDLYEELENPEMVYLYGTKIDGI
jgi:2-amino-4-hydroxy-6-hydroxymethyldihydropteridine diphosphokinase